ncbi:MAG: DUF2064 domain-containing protein [Verrucomicrobiota bacterium]
MADSRVLVDGEQIPPEPNVLSSRRALLVFADELGIDMAKRRFPSVLRPLFRLSGKTFGTSGAEVHIFTSQGDARTDARIHPQVGATFAERLENAVECLARLDYDHIVAIGRDCPSLTSDDIDVAFALLRENRLVLGPDHRGGCYLIAVRATDRELLDGIRWKRNTDCAELRARCHESEVCLLAIKHDLDSWADIRLLARVGDAAGRLAAFLVGLLQSTAREFIYFVDLAAQAVRVRGQMPPPVSAA